MGTALLSILGWGWWGYGFSGDYIVEFSDVLRVHQGSVPYLNFVPTYGILYPGLMSSLFCFGPNAVTAIFAATILLVFCQLSGLLRMNILSTGFQQTVFALLYLGLAAFSLTDSNFMIGFSQSSLFAGVLFSLTLLLLNKPITPGRAAACGFLLGLQWFTKLDMTVPSLAILFVLTLAARGASTRCSLLISYTTTVGLVVLLVLANGGQWAIFLESMTELLVAAPTLGSDSLLKQRMIAVAVGVGLTFVVMSHSRLKGLKRRLRTSWLLLFPLVGLMDLVRGENDPRKELVLIKWYLYCTTAWICMRFIWMFARRGWKVFHRERLLQFICLVVVCFFGCSRAFLSGWYPLGYSMPFLLLLLVASFPRPIQMPCGGVQGAIRVAWLAIALLFVGRAAVKYQAASDLAVFASPHGPLRVTGEIHRTYSTYVDAAHQCGEIRRTFSTYPLLPVILGSSSVNYHSVLFRLQWARPYDVQETRILRLLRDGNPELILLENTASETKALFGSDYGRKILDHIEAHYEPVVSHGPGFDPKSRRDGSTLYRKKSPTAPPAR